ncbi:MAG: M15 family metallopeptidase [Rickettsiales bacterium]
MTRRPWQDFANVRSQTFVGDLVSAAHDIAPNELMDMSLHPRESIITCLAYAQDELIYNDRNQIVAVDSETYTLTPREQLVNKFGLAYKRDSKFLLHKTLAAIVIHAADYLYKTYGWRTVLYDGLRTVDGAFRIYNLATDADLASGILALPGQSAHNKGLAVDSMMVDEDGCEIEMGGHFDHLDMSTNMRYYNGDKISQTAKRNRLIREAAFLRAAFAQDLLIAPLRNEFWDDRLPENREDLWRILDSTARCIALEYTVENKTSWNYSDFLTNWQKIFAGHEHKLMETIGFAMPPLEEKPEFYHSNYHPIYDRELI